VAELAFVTASEVPKASGCIETVEWYCFKTISFGLNRGLKFHPILSSRSLSHPPSGLQPRAIRGVRLLGRHPPGHAALHGPCRRNIVFVVAGPSHPACPDSGSSSHHLDMIMHGIPAIARLHCPVGP
jgi:hypothetical protein